MVAIHLVIMIYGNMGSMPRVTVTVGVIACLLRRLRR